MYDSVLGAVGAGCLWLVVAYISASHRATEVDTKSRQRSFVLLVSCIAGLLLLFNLAMPSLEWWRWVVFYGCVGWMLVLVVLVVWRIRRQGWSLTNVLLWREPVQAARTPERVTYALAGLVGLSFMLVALLYPCSWLDRTLGLSGCRAAIRYNGFIDYFTLAPDGTNLALIDGKDIVVLDTATGAATSLAIRLPRNVQWSPDGTRLAVSSFDEQTLIVDPATQTSVAQFSVPAVNQLHWSSDGRYLLGWEGGVWLWDSTSETLRTTWPADTVALAFTPDGQGIATLNRDGSVEIRALATEQLLDRKQIEPFDGLVYFGYLTDTLVAYVHGVDPDPTRVLWTIELEATPAIVSDSLLAFAQAANADRYIRNVTNQGQSVLTMYEHEQVLGTWDIDRYVSKVSLSADGNTMAVNVSDGVYIWELP